MTSVAPPPRPDAELRGLDVGAALTRAISGGPAQRRMLFSDAALAASWQLQGLGIGPYPVRFLADFVRARPPSAVSTDPQSATGVLTGRERETLALLARGRSNAEIASALVVSEHTVKTHVGHVLAKLGVADRTAAVERGRELRLLSAGRT